MHLTIDDLTAGYNNPDWAGYGYLGERLTALDYFTPADVAAADQAIVDLANKRGLTSDDLFTWANSRPGRHAADIMFSTAAIPAKDRAQRVWDDSLAPRRIDY